MPEELVIVLAIVIGAVWLLAKICQGVAAAIDQAKGSQAGCSETKS